MIKFLFIPGIDTGNELAIGIYTEDDLDKLQKTITALFDIGQPGDKLLIVKGEADTTDLKKFKEARITMPDMNIVPDIWKEMDSYLDWLKEKGENDD
ncbi:MAG: hypothetical protein ACP5D6_11400 [Kosmotogaceae bacterium]